MSVIIDPTTLASIPLAGMIPFVPESADLEDNLSLYIPQNLPHGRISSQEFDLWKHDLLSYLKGEKKYDLYLTGGLYSLWTPGAISSNGQCIQALSKQDPVKVMPETDTLKINDDKLLSERNNQLRELLEFIYHLNNQSGREEIFELSTSFQWIMNYLFEIHCGQRNPVDIFNISKFVINENNKDYYHLYYLKFRATIFAQLKKKGDVVEFLNGELLEDEIFSPTFEEIIVLWCLEKIDPDLPELVKQTFKDKLQGSVTLKDLQSEIFHVIPEILENIKVNDQNDIVEDDEICDNTKEETNKRVPKIKKKWKCDLCFQVFSTKQKLKLHQQKLHKQPNIECAFCLKTFKSENEKSAHINAEHIDECNELLENDSRDLLNDDKDFREPSQEGVLVESCVCDFCNKTFIGKRNLYAHKYRMHKITLQCGVCSETFSTTKSFDAHVKTHKNENVNKTVLENIEPIDIKDDIEMEIDNQMILDSTTNQPKSDDLEKEEARKTDKILRSSKIIVHPRVKNHSCDMCNKQFFDASTLKIHKQRHDIDTSACSICNEKFETKRLLSNHMNEKHKKDENEKFFPCEVCGKMFKNHNLLKSHLRIHSVNWNQYRCAVCERSFSTAEQMESHICKHYSCDLCDKKFIKSLTLKAHKKEHEGVVMFQCDLCESLFPKRKRLNEHKRFSHLGVKRHSCDFCDKEFAVKSGLNNHIRIHTGERPFKCEECGQTFRQRGALYTHSKMHTNSLPHSCDGCGQKFRTLSLLKTHKETKLCGVDEKELFKSSIKVFSYTGRMEHE